MGEDKNKNGNSAIKMLSGFIARVKIRCGKSNCRCSRGVRHLAYYHVTYSSGARLRRYVRQEQVSELREACKAHRELQAQLRSGRAEYKNTLARARELVRMLRYE